MLQPEEIFFTIPNSIVLNQCFMPFIQGGGLFIPTTDYYSLGDLVTLILELAEKKEILRIQGKIVWITSKHALHHPIAGVGIQFMGQDAKDLLNKIKENLDSTHDVGGYLYGLTEENKQ